MNRRRSTALVLATIALMCACAAADRDWRPCRSTNRRLYEELRSDVDDEDDGSSNGGNGDDENGNDGNDRDRETADNNDGDDDYVPLPQVDRRYGHRPDVGDGPVDNGRDYLLPPPRDDKPKRGVRRLAQIIAPQLAPQHLRKQYEKRVDRLQPAASGNDLRVTVDTGLLRGEVVELPTYVNVPVTLRCRFVPLDGTDDKFETVVEAMYPGHPDAPPPPPGSHASQIIGQLMGPADGGWRSAAAAAKSTRPVRRVVVDNRYGWPGEPRSDGRREVDEEVVRAGRWPYPADSTAREIAARRLAAERAQWFHSLDPRQWFVRHRPVGVRDRVARHGSGDDRYANNGLFGGSADDGDDDERTEYRTDDRGADEESVDERQAEEQVLNGGQEEQVEYQEPEERTTGERVAEESDDRQEEEPVDVGERVISGDKLDGNQEPQEVDGEHLEGAVDGQLPKEQVGYRRVERVDGKLALTDGWQTGRANAERAEKQMEGWKVGRSNGGQADGQVDGWRTGRQDAQQTDDRAAEEVDDRWAAEVEEPVDNLQQMTVALEPEITTSATSDYATIVRGAPIKTFMEPTITTPAG